MDASKDKSQPVSKLRNAQHLAFWRSLSIRQRLPLLIALLLGGVIVATTVTSYRGVRESALGVGRERLTNLTEQFANLLQQSAQTLTAKTATVASEGAIKNFVNSPLPQNKELAVNTLQQFLAPQDVSSVQVEIWSSSGSRLLTLPEGAPEVDHNLESELNLASQEPRRAVGAIRQGKDAAVYPLVAAVVDGEGKAVGYLVRWRKFAGSPESRKQLSELLGNQTSFYLGNAKNEIWTDLVGITPKPPIAISTAQELSRYSRDGVEVIALGRAVQGTPWFVILDIPEQPLLVAANRFLRRSILIGVVLFIIGVILTFLLSRNVTRPLDSLTKAATAISQGDYSRVVDTGTNDEIGKLANAFNIMAARVRESQQDLERRIASRTHELEETNKELEAFSYSVSHDLRAPLRAINGFSRILIEDHRDELPAEAKSHLDRVGESAKLMGQLVDDLLDFSRLGRQPLQKRVVNLDELVRQVINEINGGENRHKPEIQINRLPTVDADAMLLKQVYVNLLSNAFKYTRNCNAPRIDIGAHNTDKSTVFYVKDNGAGFDMKYSSKLFGVFQRLHRAEEFEGTGVGLAIVQRIIHRHGGRVWAESEVNKGATFLFELPKAN